jgi:acyl carrier protein
VNWSNCVAALADGASRGTWAVRQQPVIVAFSPDDLGLKGLSVLDFETVAAIIAKEAAIDQSLLTPEATLEDLSITSLDVLNILFAIEDQYQLEFAPSEFEKVRTLREFAAVIFAKSDSAPHAPSIG